jgi:lysophospholipase L1-like esterase
VNIPVLGTIALLGACTPSSTGPDTADTGGTPGPPPLASACLEGLGDTSLGVPDYDAFEPVLGHHCTGTNHQDITGIEKLVFLGDSITQGTPPTESDDYYRHRLTAALEAAWGSLEVDECARFGARTDDLLLDPHHDLLDCFPDVEPARTLVVMTSGGNDMYDVAYDLRDGVPTDEVLASVATYAELFRDAVHHFTDNPELFPAGVSVVFGNVYEFTDNESDMGSCPAAADYEGWTDEPLAGFREAYILMNETYMDIAVETGTDMVFMKEAFCGHGFHAGDPDNECYRGPDAATWFDFTCFHPDPAGHEHLAEMFLETVLE